MAQLNETYVDLTYRGLALGNRVKLANVRPDAGFLHLSDPMPVGTAITVAADNGPTFQVTVTEVREIDVPGCVVKPRLDSAAQAWWLARVTPIEGEAAQAREVVQPSRGAAEPALVDDGRVTEIMETAIPAEPGPQAPEKPADRSRDRGRRKRKRR